MSSESLPPASSPSALARWWRATPPGRVLANGLQRLRDRRGRTAVNILVSWAALSVVAISGVLFMHYQVTAPGVLALNGGEAGEALALKLLWIALALVVGLSLAIYGVLMIGVVQPLKHYRERVQVRLNNSQTDTSVEKASMLHMQQRRTEQLDIALEDNEHLRGEMAALNQRLDALDSLFSAVFESVTDRLIVLDPRGCIVEVSPMCIEMIGLHRSRLIGEEFDKALNFYDPFKERPLEYRLNHIAGDLLAAASPIPKLISALLVAPTGAQEQVLISAAAILDPQSRVLGAAIRLEADTAKDEKTGTATLGLSPKGDRVTGLPGRDRFDLRLAELTELARKQNVTHALVLVGVDTLHSIHDTFGHRAGEELLWYVSQTVQGEAGGNATCYRATSEYIGVLIPSRDRLEIEAMARKITSAISGRVFAWKEARYETTVSLGAADITAESEGGELLLEQASEAVRQARALGGNRLHYHVAGAPVLDRRRGDKEWVTWLTQRLDRNAIHLMSQSIVAIDPASGRLPMFEVFMRVEDEDGVWVPPGAFMRAVERHQKTAMLDLCVLQKVLDELNRNPDILDQHECACINISGRSLEDPGFLMEARQAITLSNIPGHRICFEIDEPYVVSHLSVVAQFAEGLKSSGVRLALDHYKAGGGLDALRGMGLGFVKLHESLVNRLGADIVDPADAITLAAINQICKARGILTIAAGVENAKALDGLKNAGIAYGQGMHINKMGPLLV